MSAAITTIIPTYQRPRLLRRAIRSALDQSFRDCIVRVCDNASQDETPAVVAELAQADPRIEYVRRSSNIGAAANFRAGMQDLRTPFFSFLSDDDVLLPPFYATALAAFERYPRAMMFAGRTLELGPSGELRNVSLTRWPREGLYEPPETLLRMLDNGIPTWTGVMFRSELIDDVGTLDEHAADAMDNDYELRVAAHHPIAISFEPVAAWFVHAESIYGNESAAVADSLTRTIEKIERDPAVDPAVRAAAVRRLHRQLSGKLFEVAVKAQVRNDARASAAAAELLRDVYGPRWLAALALWINGACARVPSMRTLLVRLESMRLRARSRRARRFAPHTVSAPLV